MDNWDLLRDMMVVIQESFPNVTLGITCNVPLTPTHIQHNEKNLYADVTTTRSDGCSDGCSSDDTDTVISAMVEAESREAKRQRIAEMARKKALLTPTPKKGNYVISVGQMALLYVFLHMCIHALYYKTEITSMFMQGHGRFLPNPIQTRV